MKLQNKLSLLIFTFILNFLDACYVNPQDANMCLSCFPSDYSPGIPSSLQTPTAKENCKTKNQNILRKTYYITPQPCKDILGCGTGTKETPFSNVLTGLKTIHGEINQYESSEIEILFMFYESNPIHYIYETEGVSDRILYLFKRARSSIVIKPYFCNELTTSSGCLNDPLGKIELQLKSPMFTLFVTDSLAIQNIILNGIDLSYHRNKANDKENFLRTLCSENNLANPISDCWFGENLMSDTPSTTWIPEKISKSGFIVLEMMTDCDACGIPKLALTNFELRFLSPLLSIYTFTSFVGFYPSFPLELNAENITIRRSFFPKGVFSMEDEVANYVADKSFWEKSNVLLVSKKLTDMNIRIKNITIREYNNYNIISSNKIVAACFSYLASSSQAYFQHRYTIDISGVSLLDTKTELGTVFLFKNFPASSSSFTSLKFNNFSAVNSSVAYFLNGIIPYEKVELRECRFQACSNMKIQAFFYSSTSRAMFYISKFTYQSHHLDGSLFEINSAVLNMTDFQILDLSNEVPSAPLINIVTTLKKVPIDFFVVAVSKNETADEIYVHSSSFQMLINPMISSDGIIRTLYIADSLFSKINIGYSLSLFNIHVETILVCKNCTLKFLDIRSVFAQTFVRDRQFTNVSVLYSNGSFFEGNHVQNSNRNHLFMIIDCVFKNVNMVAGVNFFDMTSRQQTAYIDLLMQNVTFQNIKGPTVSGIYILYLMRLQVMKFFSVSFQNLSAVAGIGFYKILDNPSNYPSWIEINHFTFLNEQGKEFRCLLDALYITNFTMQNSIFNAGSQIYDDFFIFIGTNVNLGSLSIINSTFSAIKTRQYGALRINILNGNSLNIKYCTFIGNFAPNYGSDVDLLFKERTTIKTENDKGISNCLFRNSLSNEAGAIHLSESGDLYVKNSLIINASSQSRGGGLTVKKLSNIITHNLTFENCVSMQSGGSIWIEGQANLTALNTSIFGSSGGLGGALYIEGLAYFKNLTNKNSKGQEGGALYVKNGNLTLIDAQIYVSYSKLRGGHIFAKEGVVTIKGAEFLSSQAEENGGSSYYELMKSVNLNSIIFRDCKSSKSATLYLYSLSTSKSYIENITFLNNRADFDPGVVAEEGVLIFNISLFRNNTARKYGLLNFFSNFQVSEVTLEAIRVEENQGGDSLVSTQNHKLILKSGIFLSNYVVKRLFFCQSGSISLISVNISSKNESNFTSARFLEASELLITIFDIQLLGSKTLGGIQALNSEFNLSKSLLKSCKSSKGGAINLQKTAFKVETTKFIENEAENAGAIFSSNSQIEITNCLFDKNRVIFVDKSSDIAVGNWLTSEAFIVIIRYSNFTDFDYNSIELEFGSNATLEALIFTKESLVNPSNTTVPAVKVHQFKWNLIKNSQFIKLGESGGLSFDSSDIQESLIYLYNCSFRNCSNAKKGGAVGVIGNAFVIEFTSSTFINNTAGSSGGAVYLNCLSTSCKAKFSGNTFVDNDAGVYGNTLSTSNSMEIAQKENFISSKNESAIEFCGFPNKIILVLLTLYNTGNKSQPLIDYIKETSLSILKIGEEQVLEIASGPKYELAAVLLDNYNNFYYLESVSKIEILQRDITNDGISLILENNKLIIINNFVIFSGFSLVAHPDKTYKLLVSFSNQDYSIEEKISIRLRRCKRGEIFINEQCNVCGADFYSIDSDPIKNNISSCLPCPNNIWCLGGDKLLAKEGFYRGSGNATTASKCNYHGACPDQRSTYLFLNSTKNSSSANSSNVSTLALQDDVPFFFQICASNYESSLCSACKDGFAGDSNFVCIECKEDTFYWLRMSGGLLMSCILMIFQAHEVWKFSDFDSQKRSLFKILINHMYYLTFLTGFNINWSEDLFSFIKATNQYSSIIPSDSINYSCVLVLLVDRENMFYAKNIVLACTPILMLLFCLIIRAVIEIIIIFFSFFLHKFKLLSTEKYQHSTNKSQLKNKFFTRFISLAIVVFYNIYSRILVATVKLLSCITIDDSDSSLYLEVNPDIVCYSSEHNKYILNIFIPNIIVWCLGWPFLIFIIIKTKSAKGGKHSFLKKITLSLNAHGINIDEEQIRNFFVIDYKSSAYYWELFFYGIGFFTAILQVTTSRLNMLSQGALLSGLYALALLITETKRPFQRGSMNSMNTLSYLTIIATISLAVLTSLERVDSKYQIIWLIGIYSANASFYCYWLYIYLKIVGVDFLRKATHGARKTVDYVKSITKKKVKKI